MRTHKSLLRQHAAKHFAELYIANSEEFEVKKGFAGNRALLPEATTKELTQRTDIHKLGWDSAAFEDLLEKANPE
eukprot:5062353-Amphidinium_carterae.1